jgi:orotidine-5'-phosphate decarboxylase
MLQEGNDKKNSLCKSSLKEKLIVALDLNDIDEVREFLNKVGDNVKILKVGMRLFTKYGPKFIKELKEKGYEIFLDMKYHDIPNTVMTACKEAAMLGIKMMTIHAIGGSSMCKAAVEGASVGAKISGNSVPIILGVTVLTSMDEEALKEVGVENTVEDEVLNLAKMVVENGATGIVCSPLEVKKLKSSIKKEFVAITPGIRLENDSKDDQKRVATPESAILDGADFLVMGRSIYKASDPKSVLNKIYGN